MPGTRLDNVPLMLRDLRHGFRVLMQAKGWTAVVILSLAVGIGANAAVFTAINDLMLKTLPVRDPDGLVRLRWAGDNDMANNSSDYGSVANLPNGDHVQTTFSYPMFEQFRAANQTLTDLAGSRPAGGITVTIDGRAETASALLTTGNYYEMLGVTARMGRTLTPADDRPSATPAAMLSYRYWQPRHHRWRGVGGIHRHSASHGRASEHSASTEPRPSAQL